MLIITSELLFCFFDFILMKTFADLILVNKKNGIAKDTMFLVLFAILTLFIAYNDIVSYFSFVLLMAISTIFLNILYSGKLINKFLIVILFHVIYAIYSSVLVFGITYIFDIDNNLIYQYGSSVRISFIITTRCFAYILLMLVSRLNKSYRKDYIVSKNIIFMAITCLLLAGVITNMLYTSYSSYTSDIVFLIAVLIMIFIVAIITEKVLFQQKINLKKIQDLENALSIKKTYSDKNSYDFNEIRRIKHDINNNLFAIETLLSEHNYEDALTYLKEISGSKSLKKVIMSGNDVVDALLNVNVNLNPEIDFDIEIHSLGLNINNMSLAVIVGNAISNSIEATKQVDHHKKNIKIIINEDKRCIRMIFENYYMFVPNITDGKLISIKLDKENHGLGLYSIENETNKFNGKINFDIDKNQRKFTLNVLLMK